jgi:hypothetical protein
MNAQDDPQSFSGSRPQNPLVENAEHTREMFERADSDEPPETVLAGLMPLGSPTRNTEFHLFTRSARKLNRP